MARTLHALAIGTEPRLADELRAGLAELSGFQGVLVHEPDLRRGVELVRTRRPELVVLELGTDLRRMERTLENLRSAAPDSILTVTYRPEEMAADGGSQETVIRLMRSGVHDFLRRPVSSQELSSLLGRHLRTEEGERREDGQVVSFISSKGGVGKSTLSVNYAALAAQARPGRVLLVDASLQHGTCSQHLGVNPETDLVDALEQDERLDERLLRSLATEHVSGLRLLAAPSNAIEAAKIGDDALSRILSVARRAFDLVVVDTFPMLDSVTVAILDVSAQTVLVTNDLVPTVAGTSNFFRVIQSIGVEPDRVRVALNRNHPKSRASLRDEDVADAFGRDLDAVLPYERRVVLAANTGEPPVLWLPRWSRYRRAVQRLGQLLETRQGSAPAPGLELPTEPHEGGLPANGELEREVELVPRATSNQPLESQS